MRLKASRIWHFLLSGIYLLLCIFAQASEIDDVWRVRSSALSDIGVLKPVVLSMKNREQHFLLPIAQNVKLKNAYFELNASYFHQFTCADGLTVQINGLPAGVFPLSSEKAAVMQGTGGQTDQTSQPEVAGQAGKELDF